MTEGVGMSTSTLKTVYGYIDAIDEAHAHPFLLLAIMAPRLITVNVRT